MIEFQINSKIEKDWIDLFYEGTEYSIDSSEYQPYTKRLIKGILRSDITQVYKQFKCRYYYNNNTTKTDIVELPTLEFYKHAKNKKMKEIEQKELVDLLKMACCEDLPSQYVACDILATLNPFTYYFIHSFVVMNSGINYYPNTYTSYIYRSLFWEHIEPRGYIQSTLRMGLGIHPSSCGSIEPNTAAYDFLPLLKSIKYGE
jgi:hypothetical protein